MSLTIRPLESFKKDVKKLFKKYKNIKIRKKLDEILRSSVNKFLQISDVLLVKIQIYSNLNFLKK